MREKNQASPDWVRITLRMTPQQRDLQAKQRTETALAERMADFGRFGRPPPAGRIAAAPRGAGPAPEGRGPETFRALVIGGGMRDEGQ